MAGVAARREAEQLFLFDCGGVDLQSLRKARAALNRPDQARGTVRGYQCDWRGFTRWCRKAGRQELPASPDTIELYATWLLVELNRKINTAARHLASIASFHRDAGQPSPITPTVRDILTSVRRDRLERPMGKTGFDSELLRYAVRKCDLDTNLGCRDRALLVMGFATALRRTEICNLQYSDIRFERQGLAILVRKSKTDQVGKGRLMGVWAGKRRLTDPVRAMRDWMERRGNWAGPLFCRIQTGDLVTRSSITGDAISDTVKRVVKSAGLNPAQYGAHSLRAGAITASAELGRSNQEIMDFSGHASEEAMHIYVRPARLFSGRNPLAGVL